QSLGGTCHSSNPYLHALLDFLGYKTRLLGADMSERNVHTCIRTQLYSHEYHIDVGYAAPFRKPMRLDKIPYQIKHGKYIYLFMKNENFKKYEIAVFLNGNKIHGYILNEESRKFNFFSKTIHESFEIGKAFMSCIRITRFFKDKTVELKNRTLIHYKGGQSSLKVLKNIEQVENAVKNDLMMPHCPIRKAVKILEQIILKPFFEGEYYPEEY
ncbi:MAG: arylamine N-acetyltransferase, partial [Desulfobacula sp.]|nr:arylamine N-acetyltransferase [Desulfobacula sp.]